MKEKPQLNAVWFWDYDGTLRDKADLNVLNDELYDLLERLQSSGSRILWNTARRIASLEKQNQKFLDFDGFFVHGTLFWSAKSRKEKLLSPVVPKAYLFKVCEFMDASRGVDLKFESKPTSIRLVFQSQLEGHSLKELQNRIFLECGAPLGWRWQLSDRSLELIPVNFSKTSALEYYYNEFDSKMDYLPVVLGDEVFDRDAMLWSLERGGWAIQVGSKFKIPAALEENKRFIQFSCASELREFLTQKKAGFSS